jgi:hypothetical protein
MPTFQGLVNEEQLRQLIEYVKTLGAEKASQPAAPEAAPAAAAPPGGGAPPASQPK